MLKAILTAALLAAAAPTQAEDGSPEPCGVRLDSLSKTSAPPGDTLELSGAWGGSQGRKLAAINRGAMTPLEIVSWSDAVIKARVPPRLAPGDYKVGVYCGLQDGNPYSSDWRDFKVLAKGERPAPAESPARPRPAVAPSPQPAAPPPSGPWFDEFMAAWRSKGRRMRASKPWLKGLRVLVVADGGVEDDVVRKVADSISAQLRDAGAGKLKVELDDSPPLKGLADCTRDRVIEERCVLEAIRGRRGRPGPYAGSILAIVTDAAIGSKPEGTAGPPAGLGDHENGWLLISDFWRHWNQEHGRGSSNPRFLDHGLDGTVRHELLHLLGLPHHEQLPNPGFAEPPLCTRCAHVGASGHEGSPHLECGMTCGAGDDDWSHQQTFGKGFGFCAKCSAAARAVIAGIEGR